MPEAPYEIRTEAHWLLEDMAETPRRWKTRARYLCQKIVAATPDGTPVSDPSCDAFLRGLLARHPCAGEKLGCGAAYFTTATEKTYGTRHFLVVRLDGTRTDFSWHVCVSPPSRKDECRKAMRAAVAGQVTRFRWQAFAAAPVQLCAGCGAQLSKQAEIDHVNPSFKDLAQEYASAVGGWDRITLEPSGEGEIGRRLGYGDNYTWKLFHQAKAVLQLLCGPCNGKKH
jgi:Protein of unknown function (DUF3223)